MQAAPTELGPFFAHVKHQSHPSPKLLDLGIQMRWGAPRHSARLYRNLRDHAPYVFGFEDVVIHEEDAIEDFDYQPSCVRRTAVGTFYPLSAFIAALYERRKANRNIFTALAELDRLLPAERPVTTRDIVNFCQSLGEAKPLPPERQADPPTDLLARDLETRGFRITRRIAQKGGVVLDIGWLPKPGARVFFTGILELRPTGSGIAGQWMPPGPCGVNRLLRREFEQLCKGPGACLSPAGRRHCLADVEPLPRDGNKAKHIDVWPVIHH
jgi:hypothetical protein